MGQRRLVIAVALLGLVVAVAAGVPALSRQGWLQGRVTVADRLREFGERCDARWRPLFAAARVAYPPRQLALLVFKDGKRMEVQARDEAAAWRWIRDLPVLAASGGPGPKLRAGDGQVPEGAYAIASLHPGSRFHVALRLDYPHAEDREQARRDGRADLGGDIMIHGGAASIGCLAMGDEAAEELFTLVARCGAERVQVLIAPTDPRRGPLAPRAQDPAWVGELYRGLGQALARFPPPP